MAGRDGPRSTRRHLLRLAAAGVSARSASGWVEALADGAAADPRRAKSCILLWMNGGPSQIDTFDPKPGHAHGGPFAAIDTTVPGLRISEHLPKVATMTRELAVIRSMSTTEADHGRATYHLRTGYRPEGGVEFPAIGSLISKELERDGSDLPNFVSIAPSRTFSPAAYTAGFLGSRYAPMIVGEEKGGGGNATSPRDRSGLGVDDLDLPAGVDRPRHDARLGLLDGLERDFAASHPGASPAAHRSAHDRAVRLMRSAGLRAFDLDEEPAALRESYGRSRFGRGCLLARRLIERGVPFVEVTLGASAGEADLGWDTHRRNFDGVRTLSATLDAGWSTLMADLRSRGLLDSTLIVWMGEFGRTPRINGQGGRDHFPAAWSTVLAGGGIRGGRVVGATTRDGMGVADRPISVPDLMATICRALGIDSMRQNISNVGRPIRLADPDGRPISEILA